MMGIEAAESVWKALRQRRPRGELAVKSSRKPSHSPPREGLSVSSPLLGLVTASEDIIIKYSGD